MSGILLYGITLIYISIGITNFTDLFLILYLNTINIFDLPLILFYGFLFILIGILFKLGVVPFHF
jgi:NADH:ubiquinone oxidoreductase subunit 2 (subunit N)